MTADPLITEAPGEPWFGIVSRAILDGDTAEALEHLETIRLLHSGTARALVVERQARQDAEKALHAIGYGYDDPDSPAYMLGFVGQRQLARAHFEHPRRAAGSGDTETSG